MWPLRPYTPCDGGEVCVMGKVVTGALVPPLPQLTRANLRAAGLDAPARGESPSFWNRSRLEEWIRCVPPGSVIKTEETDAVKTETTAAPTTRTASIYTSFDSHVSESERDDSRVSHAAPQTPWTAASKRWKHSDISEVNFKGLRNRNEYILERLRKCISERRAGRPRGAKDVMDAERLARGRGDVRRSLREDVANRAVKEEDLLSAFIQRHSLSSLRAFKEKQGDWRSLKELNESEPEKAPKSNLSQDGVEKKHRKLRGVRKNVD